MSRLFADLMVDLARQTGLPEDALGAAGPVRLVFDGTTGVEFAEDEAAGEVCLSSNIARIADEEKMGAAALLVARANFEQRDLFGAHLAMGENGEVALLRRIAVRSLDYVAFEALLTRFVDAAETWSDHFDALIGSLAGQPDEALPAGQMKV